MMKKFIILLLVISIIPIKFYSQNPVAHTIDMYPKTPEAGAASKFADIPAGNYTGVTNFTIPIYTIKTKDGSIPIELQYTTTGIKVGEIASRVGLGWSLNTGVSLSQQVMGRLDNNEQFRKPTLNSNIPQSCAGSAYPYDNPCGIALSAVGIAGFTSVAKPDLVPDIFSYNLLNGSGQFIMDFSGTFGIPRPYNLIKIKPITTSYVEGIEMIDEKGVFYTFQNHYFDLKYYNSCTSSTIPIDTETTPNYKLKTIKFPNNEIITYTFGKGTSANYITSISELENIYNRESLAQAPSYTLPATNCKNTTHSNDSALTEINFSDGKVLFYYNNDYPQGYTENSRQDLNGDVYLTRVIVKNIANSIIKDISLNYDYFMSQNEDPETYPETALDYPNVFKRLKLINIKDNLSSGEYKLSYYDDYMGKTLPNRLSYSQDFWGVYNGQPNSTGIATVKTKDWDNKIKVYPGANKQPDINYGVIGNLEKIQYPGGGFTQITYEADDFIKSSYVPSVYKYIKEESEETSLELPPVDFEITTNNPTYNKNIVLFDSASPPDTTIPTTGSTPKWELYKKNANNQYVLVDSGYISTRSVSRQDGSGIYRLKVYKPIDYRSTRIITAKYSWLNEIVVDNSDTRKTGTIRVKKIESNSTDYGKIIRRYKYVDPLTNRSSGKNAGEELFVSLSYNEIPMGPKGSWGSGSYAAQLNRINNPGWQTATVRGKAVGYDYVQEIYESSINSADNYKKLYKFLNHVLVDYPYNYISTVNVNWPTLDLNRGLILKEKLYNGNGDSIKVSEMEYEYDSYFNKFATMNFLTPPQNSNSPFIAQGLDIKIKKWDVAPGGGKTYYFNKQLFDIKNIWIKNVKTTTTDYINNQPAVVMEQTITYSIDNGQNRHTFPETQTSTIMGTGNISSQNFKYPSNLASTEPIAAQMVTANIISIPLETEVIKNGNTISKTKTNFATNTETNNLILPVSAYAKNLDMSVMEKQISYDQYDNKGNLLQYTTKSGTPTAIIWGYNQTQPIAKIVGATYAQVAELAAVIIAASDYGSPNYSETNIINKLDAFRAVLPSYQISTYTYKPLIGVTTITLPSGIREYYFYDDDNRLQSVKDVDGKILKEYKYNYKP